MSLESNKIVVNPLKCPICGSISLKAVSISNRKDLKEPVLWYFCSCGIIFQNNLPECKPKTQKFINDLNGIKEFDDKAIHTSKCYANLIEELTLGRKMLDIGYGTGHHINFMKKRGWVSFGIEKNEDAEDNDRLIKDDFETTDKIYEGQYDLVWMGNVLHHFKDPIGALWKAVASLTEDGVLFISTADIDFLYSQPNNEWIWWNSKENYIMWSLRALVRELEKMNLNVIVQRRNSSSRYGYYHDLHIIAQKKYF